MKINWVLIKQKLGNVWRQIKIKFVYTPDNLKLWLIGLFIIVIVILLIPS